MSITCMSYRDYSLPCLMVSFHKSILWHVLWFLETMLFQRKWYEMWKVALFTIGDLLLLIFKFQAFILHFFFYIWKKKFLPTNWNQTTLLAVKFIFFISVNAIFHHLIINSNALSFHQYIFSLFLILVFIRLELHFLFNSYNNESYNHIEK